MGIMHIINDSLSDVVQSDETRILYGQDFFYETLLGLRFKISTFSFFQPNSLAAEVLYSIVREYIGDTKDRITSNTAKIKFYYHEDREMGVIQVNLENLITAFLEEDEGEQERQRGYLKMFCARINPFLG